ncbi:MAG TPA: response regulator [Burkholderiaceae bacterium]|nr:response regulator [Burkholderiaceae bacterium]
MSAIQPSVALRFIGFPAQEASILEATLPIEQGRRYRYFRLPEDSLQDADAFLVNGDELAALVTLSALGPSVLRPALLIGSPSVELPHPSLPRPIRWNRLFEVLDALLDRRHGALRRLQAAPQVAVTERRRRNRLDFDLTDPAEYRRMRAAPSANHGVLLVDYSSALQNVLAAILAPHQIGVTQVHSAAAALDACANSGRALVLINTAMPETNPYRLCDEIKKRSGAARTAVVFLTDASFHYDRIEAKVVGCDGFLAKPVAPQQLLPVLNKFLPLAR